MCDICQDLTNVMAVRKTGVIPSTINTFKISTKQWRFYTEI